MEARPFNPLSTLNGSARDRQGARDIFDLDSFERGAQRLASDFKVAEPFPHIVLDGLIRLPPDRSLDFPGPAWHGWTPLGDSYQHNKRFCNDIDCIPEPFASLIHELSGPRFLRALEVLTGIRRLIPDPYLNGGGLHLSGPGGVLSPHTDFHHYRLLNLYRRVNILVYFNDGWSEESGGCLELRDELTGDRKLVVPTWGRCVIFATDDDSVHGFPVPVAEGSWRRSVALYYYTADESPTFSGDETTYWRDHGTKKGVARLRLSAYRCLLNVSRAVSLVAHVVNPNQGAALVRTRLRNRRAGL